MTSAPAIPAAAVPGVDFPGLLVSLGELGPSSEIRKRAPAEIARALDLDRVLLSSVRQGALVADALHASAGPPIHELLSRLRDQPVPLAYPLLEAELMRQRRAKVIRWTPDDSTDRRAFMPQMEWHDYVAAPILLEARTIGFLHADRGLSGRPLEDSDADALAGVSVCFGLVYERSVLRHRLRLQHQDMRQVAAWADVRTSELGDRSVTLGDDGDVGAEDVTVRTSAHPHDQLRDLFTRREREVLELMVRGETNAGIARELVVSEGTVKFHVKNVLRKLHATNRAEAVSRYLRLTLNRSVDPQTP